MGNRAIICASRHPECTNPFYVWKFHPNDAQTKFLVESLKKKKILSIVSATGRTNKKKKPKSYFDVYFIYILFIFYIYFTCILYIFYRRENKKE